MKTLLAALLVGAAISPAAAQFRLWGSPPQPSRTYTVHEVDLLAGSQQGARVGAERYFIDDGRVFRLANPPRHVKGSSRVAAVVSYKDQLIALRRNGNVYLWIASKEEWVDIGNSTEKVLVVGDDLVALTRNSQIWVYKGRPGGLNLTVTTQLIPDGNGGLTMLLIPTIDGHEVAFFDSKLRDVASIEPASSDATIRFKDGRSISYARLELRR